MKEDPHIYAVAEMAYTHMVNNAQSQSLLVAGESGAGKTETNKQLLDYLIWRAGVHAGSPNAANLARDIQDTNPVLEAFGNAKTIRNNNSSRFGKYINLKFSSKYQIMGAEVRTFLLEKSRVTSTSNSGERAYHVFYQLLAGSQAGKGIDELKGKKPEDFTYLSLSDTQRTEAIDDTKDFNEMHDALLSCGITEEDRTNLYKVIAAILTLGNVTLEDDGDDACKLAGDAGALIDKVDELLGISDIKQLLVIKVMQLPDGSKIEKPLTKELAKKQKDALSKYIFSLLFDLLVCKMNAKIDADKHFHKFVGLLDVFGFEVFAVNSFEQLSINYANERLHNFFLMRVFEVEIELYRMQSLQVPTLSYPDNAKIIELLEKSPSGIFPTLDAQCKMPKASDDTFCQAIHKNHGPDAKAPHPAFDKLSHAKLKGVHMKDDECFVIKHFAADVCYTSTGFLEKNTDALASEFTDRLTSSKVVFVQQLVTGLPDANVEGSAKSGMSTNRGNMSSRNRRGSMGGANDKDGKAGAKGPQQSSVGKKFLNGLKQLMREIATTHPYFVRCIKPNNTLKPGDYMGSMILRQMQCSGTIECVKLMQAGYPSRAPYDDLRERFKNCLPPFFKDITDSKFVEMLLMSCDTEEGDYQLGQDMVFFKGTKGSLLQDLMMMKKDDLAMAIVDGMKKKGGDTKQIEKLIEFVEGRKKDKLKAREKMVTAAVAVMNLFTWVDRFSVIKKEKNAAAIKVQALARGREARKTMDEYKKAKAAGEQEKLAAMQKKMEEERAEAEKAAKEAAAVESVASLSLEEQLAASAQMEADRATLAAKEMSPEEKEHEEKWFYTLPDGQKGKGGDRFHRFLMCKGVEWGFQYHNFYGDWELSTEEPLCNDRPHYVHNTMYGGYAHLFHCMDPHYHVPRWVIGPAPGNENGWAFCESDANTPHEVAACWISWDGFEWHTCKNFRYVTKEHELDGLSDDDDLFDEEAEFAAYQEAEKRREEEEAAAAAQAKAADAQKQQAAKDSQPAARTAETKPVSSAISNEKASEKPEKEGKDKKGKKEEKKGKKEKGGFFGGGKKKK